jgi:hypothetical protein
VPLLALTVVVPATAAGARTNKLWVSSTGTLGSAPGTSCANPGYRTIQSAIDVAGNYGATIEVCGGTYTEQLTITTSVTLKATGGAVTLVLPATPANATTSCDLAVDSTYSTTDQDAISICGPVSVGLSGLTVQAVWPAAADCGLSMNAIEVGGDANLSTTNVAVTGAGPDPINGWREHARLAVSRQGRDGFHDSSLPCCIRLHARRPSAVAGRRNLLVGAEEVEAPGAAVHWRSLRWPPRAGERPTTWSRRNAHLHFFIEDHAEWRNKHQIMGLNSSHQLLR